MSANLTSCLLNLDCSAQRVARQGETVMALHQSVQHGVGDGSCSDPCVPMFDRQLTGDDRGLVGSPVVNDFQQVGTGLAVDARHAPVVRLNRTALNGWAGTRP